MKFLRSFSYAWSGIRICFRSGTNFKIHFCVAAIVIMLSLLLHIRTVQWLLLLFAIALVIAMEMMNTAIEKLCDIVEPGLHPLIKIVKDISAGAVLVMAVFSLITGVIIFLPAVFSCLKNG